MSNSTRDLERNVRRNERNQSYKKSGGAISDGRLISCYLASAAIIILCIYEIIAGDDIVGGNFTYIFLAVAAAALSIIITIRNKEAKSASRKKHK